MNFSLRTSTLVIVDIQEKLIKAIPAMEPFMPKVRMMLEAAAVLGLDVIVTEQYPKGLGNTVPELKELFQDKWPVIEKTSFSCWLEPEFRKQLRKNKKETVILTGIESHVCVMQTAMDLLTEGYQVVLLADTVASRNDYDREIALKLMREKGVWVMTAESLLFHYLQNAKNPSFKAVSKLIK